MGGGIMQGPGQPTYPNQKKSLNLSKVSQSGDRFQRANFLTDSDRPTHPQVGGGGHQKITCSKESHKTVPDKTSVQVA